jgi:UPF0755 protein
MLGILCAAVVLFFIWQIYVPYSLNQKPSVVYTIEKGMAENNIALDLQKKGIIKNNLFFNLYVTILGQYSKIQAGKYNISPSMSLADIVKKFSTGDVIKNNATIIEGWTVGDVATYFENRQIFAKTDFLHAATQDFSNNYSFLKDKPKNINLEGYIFPDTYQISLGETPQQFLQNALDNFNKKLTPDLRSEISHQHKSLFEIITMASILEKEVKSLQDKKLVAGILWKRLNNGMPLQVDATINYANYATLKSNGTGKRKNPNINSAYNTYKYSGLPLGPISNPGMDSILAAIYPKDSPYWFYLSAAGTGETIFSKTFDQHNFAIAKYLK